MKPQNEMKLSYFKVSYLIRIEGYEKTKAVVIHAPDREAAIQAAMWAECHNGDAMEIERGSRWEDDCFIYEIESVRELDSAVGAIISWEMQND